ncbi:hypothetical protein AAFC00_000617 [Neodothiora populina]|uniref:Bestrophin n=1 Tax=Neodothiora populina TaxID=2781224 RepID=A0ABR3PDI9_9PEZI
MVRHHHRTPTFPLAHRARQKPRRMPLVLRFIKGSIHLDIAVALILHALWSALVVYLDRTTTMNLRLPGSITSSLSIVVGLLLVFRNQSSYYRFWSGQEHLTTICASVRNLTRSFLTCSYVNGKAEPGQAERADVEGSVHVLLAIVYATKNTLRFEWGVAGNRAGGDLGSDIPGSIRDDVACLLPSRMRQAFEHQGLGLPIQLTIAVEGFIKRGHDRGWFHSPQASQLTAQLNGLVAAYSAMETIRLTPLPVAYQIHTKQVLALFGGVLPFAFLEVLGWWTILVVGLINFTLYGIEAIAEQLEEPFGYDRNDIKMENVLEDLRLEVDTLVHQWRIRGPMFARVYSGDAALI